MENPTAPEVLEPIWKTRRFLLSASVLIGLILIAAASIYTWYYWINPCEAMAVEEASSFLISQMKRYDDVYMVTTNAPPTMLVRPVAELQQIMMDTQGVPVPVCMQTAKYEAVNYMGTVIRAFQAYAAQKPNETIRGLLDESTTHFINFSTELDAIEKCAPFCAPWD